MPEDTRELPDRAAFEGDPVRTCQVTKPTRRGSSLASLPYGIVTCNLRVPNNTATPPWEGGRPIRPWGPRELQ